MKQVLSFFFACSSVLMPGVDGRKFPFHGNGRHLEDEEPEAPLWQTITVGVPF
jgi:hypothetical protein